MSKEILNKYKLTFKDEILQKEYNNRKNRNIQYHTIFYTILNIILSFILNIIELLKINDEYSTYNKINLGILGIIFTILILSFIYKKIIIQKLSLYFNFYFSIYVFISFRISFKYKDDIEIIIQNVLLILEFIYSISYFFTEKIEFFEGLFLNLSSIVCLIITIKFNSISPYKTSLILSLFCNLITIILSWFIIMTQKKKYYYLFQLNNNYKWLKSVSDNLSIGIVNISNLFEVKYLNKKMMEILNYNNEIADNSSIEFKYIKDFISQINIDFKEILTKLDINYSSDRLTYINLGNTRLKNNFFELYGRKIYDSYYKEYYEFLIIDINKEFKDESIENHILSKIEHEFKNPLIYISELCEQMSDDLSKRSNKEFITNNQRFLSNVKTMSKYLLIMLKDLDLYYKINSSDINIEVKYDYVKINDIINFCEDLTNVLISKFDKENFIKFLCNIDEDIPSYIYTDEIILKQILINLLKNSVKFTNTGYITLNLKSIENGIQFIIKDSGSGLSKNQLDSLNSFGFRNDTSSSIGFTIIKTLIEKLGSKIEYQYSDISSFTFFIKTNNDLITEKRDDSNSTIMIQNLDLCKLNKSSNIFNNQFINLDSSIRNKKYKIIIVDDEIMTRKSTIRVINNYFKNSNEVTIIDVSDGIECLNYVYESFKNGNNISFILSDETMTFMNGSKCADILKEISIMKNFNLIPYFILTAYENFILKSDNGINAIFTKPMNENIIKDIISKFKINKY